MGYYVNQKCGGCKKSLTHGYVANYSGIGQPFVVCPRCGVSNDNSGRVTEWRLKSVFGRSVFVFWHVLSVIFYYGAGAGLIGVILLGAEIIHSMTALVALIAFSLIFGLARFVFRLSRSIEASNARMSDPGYVAQLRQLGYPL